MLHRTPAGGTPASLPPRLARLTTPIVVLLHAVSPCETYSHTLYCVSRQEADGLVAALTDEGWTFTREEVRA